MVNADGEAPEKLGMVGGAGQEDRKDETDAISLGGGLDGHGRLGGGSENVGQGDTHMRGDKSGLSSSPVRNALRQPAADSPQGRASGGQGRISLLGRPSGTSDLPGERQTPRKGCNCKNSRCLKLYCECFASGQYCSADCNCQNCCNNLANEGIRQEAVEATLDRNPNAFRPKIAPSPLGQKSNGMFSSSLADDGALGQRRHNKGCNCKKSGCLKKYCECFQAGVFCGDNCRCLDCRNYHGYPRKRISLFPPRSRGAGVVNSDSPVPPPPPNPPPPPVEADAPPMTIVVPPMIPVLQIPQVQSPVQTERITPASLIKSESGASGHVTAAAAVAAPSGGSKGQKRPRPLDGSQASGMADLGQAVAGLTPNSHVQVGNAQQQQNVQLQNTFGNMPHKTLLSGIFSPMSVYAISNFLLTAAQEVPNPNSLGHAVGEGGLRADERVPSPPKVKPFATALAHRLEEDTARKGGIITKEEQELLCDEEEDALGLETRGGRDGSKGHKSLSDEGLTETGERANLYPAQETAVYGSFLRILDKVSEIVRTGGTGSI